MITESREPTSTTADFDETENRQADAADGLLTRDNENDDVSYKKDDVADGLFTRDNENDDVSDDKDDAASGQYYGDRVRVEPQWYNRSNRVLRRRRK